MLTQLHCLFPFLAHLPALTSVVLVLTALHLSCSLMSPDRRVHKNFTDYFLHGITIPVLLELQQQTMSKPKKNQERYLYNTWLLLTGRTAASARANPDSLVSMDTLVSVVAVC